VDDPRKAMGPDQVMLGNLDPVRELLYSSPANVLSQLREKHAEAGARYVVWAGCEISVDTAFENVEAMVAYARSTQP
jgi:uroporphyrinogen-III decarboxylase